MSAVLVTQKCIPLLSRTKFVQVLSRQKPAHFCRDKHNFCLYNYNVCGDKNVFVAVQKLCLWQLPPIIVYHWRELPKFVFFLSFFLFSRQQFYRDKTHLLSQQKYACRDKHNFVSTKVGPTFVATKLGRQKCVV